MADQALIEPECALEMRGIDNLEAYMQSRMQYYKIEQKIITTMSRADTKHITAHVRQGRRFDRLRKALREAASAPCFRVPLFRRQRPREKSEDDVLKEEQEDGHSHLHLQENNASIGSSVTSFAPSGLLAEIDGTQINHHQALNEMQESDSVGRSSCSTQLLCPQNSNNRQKLYGHRNSSDELKNEDLQSRSDDNVTNQKKASDSNTLQLQVHENPLAMDACSGNTEEDISHQSRSTDQLSSQQNSTSSPRAAPRRKSRVTGKTAALSSRPPPGPVSSRRQSKATQRPVVKNRAKNLIGRVSPRPIRRQSEQLSSSSSESRIQDTSKGTSKNLLTLLEPMPESEKVNELSLLLLKMSEIELSNSERQKSVGSLDPESHPQQSVSDVTRNNNDEDNAGISDGQLHSQDSQLINNSSKGLLSWALKSKPMSLVDKNVEPEDCDDYMPGNAWPDELVNMQNKKPAVNMIPAEQICPSRKGIQFERKGMDPPKSVIMRKFIENSLQPVAMFHSDNRGELQYNEVRACPVCAKDVCVKCCRSLCSYCEGINCLPCRQVVHQLAAIQKVESNSRNLKNPLEVGRKIYCHSCEKPLCLDCMDNLAIINPTNEICAKHSNSSEICAKISNSNELYAASCPKCNRTICGICRRSVCFSCTKAFVCACRSECSCDGRGSSRMLPSI